MRNHISHLFADELLAGILHPIRDNGEHYVAGSFRHQKFFSKSVRDSSWNALFMSSRTGQAKTVPKMGLVVKSWLGTAGSSNRFIGSRVKGFPAGSLPFGLRGMECRSGSRWDVRHHVYGPPAGLRRSLPPPR